MTLDRREFLSRSGALGGLVATGGLGTLLNACGGGDGNGGAAQATKSNFPAPETADVSGVIYEDLYPDLPRGGTLRFGQSGQLPTSLDVFTDSNGANAWSADPAHDWLEHYQPNGELRPSLAESFELVDELTFRYALHEGAKFHNGAPVTSEDVKQVYEWVQDPKNKSFLAPRIAGVKVKTVDERTLELRLPTPDASLRAQLAAIPIVPIESIGKQASQPVGCGPYVFDKWVKDSYVSFRKNPDYWNPDAPRADALRIDLYAEIQTGARAFLSGQNEWVTQVSLTQLPDFRRREQAGELGISLFQQGWLYVSFNHEVEPYDNPKVRQAIGLALDRDAMAASALQNGGSPLFFAGIVPDHPWYPKDLEYRRDVEKAKSLLAQAGKPNGFSDKLLTLDKDYFQATNTVVQSNLREIGVDVELEVVDIATLIDRTFATRKFTITTLGDAMSPEPSTQLDAYFRSDGGNNYFGYSNKQVDSLLRKARQTYAPNARKQLYREVFTLLFLEDFAAIPITTEPGLGIYKPAMNGQQFRPDPIARFHYPIAAKKA